MNTDKKIRDFFMSSRPEYDDNDAFMREFERQSAMLPQPASMNTPEDMEKAERLQTLRRVSSMIRRTYHIDAAVTSAAAIAVCLLCFTLVLSATIIFPLF